MFLVKMGFILGFTVLFFYHHFQFWIKWSVFKCLCLLNDALHLPSEFQVNHIQFECFCLWFLIHSYLAKHVHEFVCIIKIHWNIKKNISFPIKLQADFFQHIDFIMNRKKPRERERYSKTIEKNLMCNASFESQISSKFINSLKVLEA